MATDGETLYYRAPDGLRNGGFLAHGSLTGVSSFRDRRPTGRRWAEEGVDGTAVILLRLMLDGVISAEQIERARD